MTGISYCKKTALDLENKASLDSAYIESINLPDSIDYLFIPHGEICLSGKSEEYKESIYFPNLDSSFISSIILNKYPRLKISSNVPNDSTMNYLEI